MAPDKDGNYVGYYGSYNIHNKPKYGVHYFMLDEYIKNSVARAKESFKKEMAKMLEESYELSREQCKKLDSEIRNLRLMLTEIKEQLHDTVKLNDLKKPEVKEGKRARRKKEEVIVEKEDDDFDGDVYVF